MWTCRKPDKHLTLSQGAVAVWFSEGCQWKGMRQLLERGIVMRIAFGAASDGEVKINVAEFGDGRSNVVTSVVLVRCMVTDV